jgi:CDP-2,3-bis-(O-geranylgeranyl)-sn-glycerol synthase
MVPWAILQSLVILTLANGTPVVAKKILGTRFARPLDGGMTFFDKRALFGSSKTVRGVVVSILATAAGAPLIDVEAGVGALMAAAAMAGDLFSSFVKRRLDLPPSSQALGLDQVPESLLPLLVGYHALSLTAIDILIVVAIFFIGEILLSRVLYKLRLRDQPY